jgi:hypothetical protein
MRPAWLAGLLVSLLLADPAAAITKRQADAKARKVFTQSLGQDRIWVVFGMPRALPAGTRVFEAGPGRSNRRTTRVLDRGARVVVRDPHRPLRRAVWMYWADLAPGGAFGHPSILLLLDRRTGNRARLEGYGWQPLVNGREVPWLRTLRGYRSPRYRVAESPAPAAPAPTPARVAQAQPPPPVRADRSNDCMITIGDLGEPMFRGSIEAMEGVARRIGLRYERAETAGDLDARIRSLRDRRRRPRCQDVLLFIAGHGSPPPDVKNHQAEPSNQAQATVSQVASGGGRAGKISITADEVRAFMRRYRKDAKVTFKLIVDSCYSGRWIEELRNVANLRIVAASAQRDQVSFRHNRKVEWRGTQRNGILRREREGDARTGVEDPTGGPHEATGFGNGIASGLEAWAREENAGADLAKGVARAFQLQADQNFPEQLGWQRAVIGDWSDQRPELALGPAPLTGEGEFAFFGDPSEVNFFVSFSGPVDGLVIEVPGGRRVTNWIDPAGQQCAPDGSRLRCNGALAAGQTAQGRIRTDPPPASGMGGTLYALARGGETRAGAIRGP